MFQSFDEFISVTFIFITLSIFGVTQVILKYAGRRNQGADGRDVLPTFYPPPPIVYYYYYWKE